MVRLIGGRDVFLELVVVEMCGRGSNVVKLAGEYGGRVGLVLHTGLHLGTRPIGAPPRVLRRIVVVVKIELRRVGGRLVVPR